ncbi:hypothetical protein AB0F73_01690 [Micromonospora purpureochromogenes]|uniref:hypothetical protein n=1 Tax=Micromonospora purpureochromogenes TaxID=47872 RepID=UPI0033CF1851
MMVMQSRLTPGLMERMLARQVDKAHLSRDEPAAATSGNVFSPAPGAGSVDGGWGGRRRTATRRLVTAALLTTAAVAGARRWRR